MFLDILMFHEISLSPQVKRSAIISNIQRIYIQIASRVDKRLKTFDLR